MKTKIVATIGPACSDYSTLAKMATEGMDVCRLNFSHGTHEDHQKTIDIVEQINKLQNNHIAILADLQGPKIRLGALENDFVALEAGDQIRLVTYEVVGNNSRISIRYDAFASDVKTGDLVLIDDGKIALRVIETNGIDEVLLKAETPAKIEARKGVNLPDTSISLPSLTEKDLKDLDFLLQQDIQWIALSFVRSAKDIHLLREKIEAGRVANKPGIIAKIEKPQALSNIEAIVDASDGIMIARGDLGVEIPMEQVPMIQKRIIQLCQKKGKPVIVATQMMEAMISSIRPTRAEVSDVANSVLDGADALMLSGETSVGKYPVDTIRIMQQIINQIEDYEAIYYRHEKPNDASHPRFISDSVLFAASNMAQSTNASAIIVSTHTGYSATRLASHRPKAKLFAFSGNKFVLRQMNLLWGIYGFFDSSLDQADKLMNHLNDLLIEAGQLQKGDRVIHVLSTPAWSKGNSNTLRLGEL
ncbi:MAG: pyruvate kinase [Bacteroidales bacterium]|jgi:pyruvate kinase|nr:pyruvate kinase [Bacteroidales bacterium]